MLFLYYLVVIGEVLKTRIYGRVLTAQTTHVQVDIDYQHLLNGTLSA
jgi:hypothetical protein